MEEVARNDAPQALPPSLGETLARGREEQGLTRNDIAQRLHMSPSQVEALEGGDYTRLPKGTFLRGFVRNYAKLVGIDPESVLPMLAEGAPTHPAPGIVVPSQNIRFDPLGQRLSGPWVRAGMTAGVVIALAFAAMYWWLFMRPQPPTREVAQAPAKATAPAVAPVKPAPAPVSAEPPVVVPPASPVEPSGAPPKGAPLNAMPPKAAPPSVTPPKAGDDKAGVVSGDVVPAATSTPAPGDRRLHFRFKGESWVEVRDASGKVVFRQLNPAGSEASANGRPPLHVVVGNANEVELDKDGEPVEFKPLPDTDVARFKVE
jgi:cytoskeleton protein RodZ